jgi:hypothetical protein
MADFRKLAEDYLLERDDLVSGGDWLSDEEKAGVRVVTDGEWEALAEALAAELEQAAIEWWAANGEAD